MDRIVAAASRRPLTFRDDADQSMAQTSSSLAAGPARLAASARSSSRSGHPSPDRRTARVHPLSHGVLRVLLREVEHV